MKLNTNNNRYILQIEPGETLDIIFAPDGLNAIPGGKTELAISVGPIILPNAGLAISIGLSDELLYKSVPTARGNCSKLILCQGNGSRKLEYIQSEEAPRIVLSLEKISMGDLLNENPPG